MMQLFTSAEDKRTEFSRKCRNLVFFVNFIIFFIKRYLTKPNFFYKNERQFLLIKFDCEWKRDCAIMTPLPGFLIKWIWVFTSL